MRRSRWKALLLCAPLLLLFLPLRAQEKPPVALPSPASTPPREVPPAPEPEEKEKAGADDEKVSADNSLSFPVDI